MDTKKYIIIAGATLLLLIFVYATFLIIRQSDQQQNTMNTPTVAPTTSQNSYNIPTSTPAPSNPLPANMDPTAAANYSPIDQAFLDQMKRDEIAQRPDVTVSNSTPYNNDYFLANTEFVQAQPAGYFKLIIYPTTGDESEIDEEVNKWLSSLGLPSESIAKLVIEKRPLAKEMRNL